MKGKSVCDRRGGDLEEDEGVAKPQDEVTEKMKHHNQMENEMGGRTSEFRP